MLPLVFGLMVGYEEYFEGNIVMNFVVARDDCVLKCCLDPAPILRQKIRNKNQQFYLCFDGSPPRSSSFHFHKMNTEFFIIS